MALLEIRDLDYRTEARPIIRQLSLGIPSGKIHALLGTNGTGKSTLAYLVMGCEGYRPTAGQILFAGEEINSLPIHARAKRGITLAWQEPARIEGLNVRRYLDLHQSGLDPTPFLEKVGLNPALYLDRHLDRTLSGGERKRIELASILALRPRLAILDEPDSGIDMLSTEGLRDVIRSFRECGSAALLITHREEIARMADRASQMCDGRIVFSGSPQEVIDHYRGRRCLVCDGRECGHV
jgi:Fe-S cluster assembly ATP-binding protein